MVTSTLVDRDVAAGEGLVQALDGFGFRAATALWLYDSDVGEWRLVISTPAVDQQGPRPAYAWLQNIMARLSPPPQISLRQIALVSPSNGLASAIGDLVQRGWLQPGVHYTDTRVGDMHVDAMLIYRGAPAAA